MGTLATKAVPKSIARWCALVAVAFILAVPLFDTAAIAGSPKEQQTAETMTWLDVAALDRHSQPVIDLNQDDFQVYDDGKRQRIVYFRPPASMRLQLATVVPHEFGNRGEAGISPPTVILLDLLNARFLVRYAGWEELIRALQTLKSPDSVYLYLLSIHGALHPVHPLSLTPAGNPAGPSWTANIEDALNRLMREESGLRTIEEQDPLLRTSWTYKALNELGNSMAAFPGRKSLVWISHGVPASFPLVGNQWFDSAPYLRALSANFARTRIAVYTVDQWADGVGVPGSLTTQTLEQVSALTGGRTYASDHTEVAITGAIGDAGACYAIGYFPQSEKSHGKFHKIRVTIDRPGLRAQVQQGYYADRAPLSPEARTVAILRQAAARLPDDPGIGLRASLSALGDSPAAMHLRIRVDAADLLLSAQDRRYSGQIELAVAGYTDDGPQELVPPAPIDLTMTEEERDRYFKDGLKLTRDLSLDSKIRAIRIFLVDRRSGASGSLTIPLALSNDSASYTPRK